MKKGESERQGYILRISKDEWVKQVYDRKKYYVGVRRRWKPGLTILFARKAEKGDSFIGYGVVGSVQGVSELSEEERGECEKEGWKHALNFESLFEFEPPLLIKETVLKDVKARGKYLHGLRLTQSQIQSILSQAERWGIRKRVHPSP